MNTGKGETNVVGRRRLTAPSVLLFACLLVLGCAPSKVEGYMQHLQENGAGGAQGAAGGLAQGGVQPQVTGDTGDTEIMDGVTTADLLKLIGGQPMVDEQAEGAAAADEAKAAPASTFGNIKHDHGGDGHMCNPDTALHSLGMLKQNEAAAMAGGRGGKKKKGSKKKSEKAIEDVQEATEARIGFERCLHAIMPGLTTTDSFQSEITCHTKVAMAQMKALKRQAESLNKRLQFTKGNNEIKVAQKARNAVAMYNGFQACVKEAIPTLHEAVLGTNPAAHNLNAVKIPKLDGKRPGFIKPGQSKDNIKYDTKAAKGKKDDKKDKDKKDKKKGRRLHFFQ